MGILNEAKDALLKYGGLVVQKTELYTKIAKLNIEIQRLNFDVDKTIQGIGNFVLNKVSDGETSLNLTDHALTELTGKVKNLQDQISLKKNQIESLKNEDSKK